MILASQSEARRRLLLRLGFSFETIPAHVDEATVQKREPDPRRLVKILAKAKALHVFDSCPEFADRVVIGSDQVLALNQNGKPLILGKPLTTVKARRQLELCSGQEVSLITGVHVEASAAGHLSAYRKTWVHVVKMKFRELTAREIRDYVALDEPLECAGSFKFEEHGISLFSRVTTSDSSSIEGLPLFSLHEALLQSGRHF